MSGAFWNGILADHAAAQLLAEDADYDARQHLAANREARIDAAIATFNFNPPYDEFYGRKVAHRARRPIVATDCDYEIVTVSGVQGRRLEQ